MSPRGIDGWIKGQQTRKTMLRVSSQRLCGHNSSSKGQWSCTALFPYRPFAIESNNGWEADSVGVSGFGGLYLFWSENVPAFGAIPKEFPCPHRIRRDVQNWLGIEGFSECAPPAPCARTGPASTTWTASPSSGQWREALMSLDVGKITQIAVSDHRDKPHTWNSVLEIHKR